jgi:hypothetical protein
MQIIDYSAMVVAAVASHPDATLNDMRHLLLDRILDWNKKFKPEYGRPIIAVDSKSATWRKKYFPYYKVKRREVKANAPFSWEKVEQYKDHFEEEFRNSLPYHVIRIEGAEADDIIGALVKYSQTSNTESIYEPCQEPVMIISRDKDFGSLQVYSNVAQYDFIDNRQIRIAKPKEFLAELILKGDSSDSIPNLLSDDDVFVTTKRQTPITKKRIEDYIPMLMENRIGAIPEEFQKNYIRNKTLIDLVEEVPDFVTEQVKLEMQKPVANIDIMSYMIKHRMRVLNESGKIAFL